MVNNVLILFLLLGLPLRSFANDETWMSIVVKAQLSKDYYILSDYVRRDTDTLFQDRFRDLYRSYLGYDYNKFSFLVGGAIASFENQPTEFRLIQQSIYKIIIPSNDLSGYFRFGFEQRKFTEDSHWYLRFRAKLQLIPWSSLLLSPAVYNEVFIGASGAEKFKNGFNENRFAVGARAIIYGIETFIFFVNTNQVSTKGTTQDVQWLQFQTNFKF